MNSCTLCPRNCKVNRAQTVGFCNQTQTAQISKVMLHYGEEPFLVNANKTASGAIFFSGCNLKCVYCQNYCISNGQGKPVSVSTLINLYKQLELAGAANIDLVTPTHFSDIIYESLKIYKPGIPVIYNCGGYETPEIITKMAQVVDIFLIDLKYFSNQIAIRLSAAPNYFDYASKSIEVASKLKTNKFKNRQLISGVVVRHLCLPSYVQDSKNILTYLSKTLGQNALISIMSQYSPMGKANQYPEINRTLKPLEYKIIVNHAKKLRLKNALIQDSSSKSDCLVPNWKNQDPQFKF